MIQFRSFIFLCSLLVASFLGAAEHEVTHEFMGRHFIASYLECDSAALTDVKRLSSTMKSAVKACGATILDSCEYIFPPDGMTMVILLSESHASIHTYPEYGSCFVDLFTCGENCSAEIFDQKMRAYLKPKNVNKSVLIRNQQIQQE
jgi:S-adenosylmethionine decarboxylase proenzyme